ncbi:hypothetical protein ADIARSV_3098 [Arcticibacter svalbardensis MN12-7]|uniref:Uncharacterized protein n=1 Tax=Arcticibacter svalbardensis MN12-7 TaxID=1150600 RepID=R9GPY1_9SPHI|nr:hypothetical protein ADIARSV_3098 [Arcticibacter svalbardensis MN12-7]
MHPCLFAYFYFLTELSETFSFLLYKLSIFMQIPTYRIL